MVISEQGSTKQTKQEMVGHQGGGCARARWGGGGGERKYIVWQQYISAIKYIWADILYLLWPKPAYIIILLLLSIRNNERFHIVCRTHVHQCVKISVIYFGFEADFISILKSWVRVVRLSEYRAAHVRSINRSRIP